MQRPVAVDSAGVVLIHHHGKASPLGVSNEAAGAVEDLQFTLGEGPAFDAHTGGRAVLEPSLDATLDDRWPAFAPAAVEAGYLGASGSRCAWEPRSSVRSTCTRTVAATWAEIS